MEQFLLGDFLITITIGLYFVVSSVLVHGAMVDQSPLPAWLRPRNAPELRGEDAEHTPAPPQQSVFSQMGFAALVVLALFLGLFANVISDSLGSLSGEIRFPVLVSEQKNRAAVLFDQDGVKPLGAHLVELDVFAAVGGADGVYAQQILSSGRIAIADQKRLRDASSAVYYHTKNVIYDRKNYFNEMSHLQRQIDFMRSLAAITLAQFFYATAMLLLRKSNSTRPGFVERWHGMGKSKAGLTTLPSRVLCVFVIIVVFVACRHVFKSLEQEFNKRAYGYYASAVAQGVIDRVVPRAWPAVTESLSGMALLSDTEAEDSPAYLVVHDRKRGQDGARFGIVRVADGMVSYSPLALFVPEGFADPSDLESVCRLPGRELEFLAAESSNYDSSQPGRVLHVRLRQHASMPTDIELLGTSMLPAEIVSRDPADETKLWDQIEGIACIPAGNERVVVLLGERMKGDLYLAEFSNDMQFQKIPGAGPPEGFQRAIADLYFDQTTRTVLAAATVELQTVEGMGPFATSIYALATFDTNVKLTTKESQQELWRLEGLKVEAIAATPWQQSPVAIGTDDENLGGTWRILRARGSNP